MAHINQSTLNSLKGNEPLIFRISQAMGVAFRTVERWVRDNDSSLAVPAVRLIIADELKVEPDSILLSETVTA